MIPSPDFPPIKKLETLFSSVPITRLLLGVSDCSPPIPLAVYVTLLGPPLPELSVPPNPSLVPSFRSNSGFASTIKASINT